MIKIYKNNQNYGVDQFILNLQYYMSKIEVDDVTIDYSIGDSTIEVFCPDISYEYLYNLKVPNSCRSNILLQLILIIRNDILCIWPEKLDEYESWIREFSIEVDNIRTPYSTLLSYADPILTAIAKGSDSYIYDYLIGFYDTILCDLDLNKNWIVLFHYLEDDEDLYPYPDHKSKLETIKKDFSFLSNSKIVKDNYIGYFLVDNDITDDDYMLLKLSLSTNDKIFSSYNIQSFYIGDDNG